MKTQLLYRLIIILVLGLLSQTSYSQDIEGLISDAKALKDKFKEPLKITGGVSLMGAYNDVRGIPRRTDPFNYQISTSLNISTFGINTPLSFNFSNGRSVFNYDLPEVKLPRYTFVGLSPTYKWATLHVGDRNMTFSPYTLSGHSFKGIGTELKPGKFYFGAMYGRLQRAQAEDLNSLQSLDPAFKRVGWGLKTGYDSGKDHIFLILFKAWDDIHSIPPIENTPEITPAENTTISLQAKKEISKVISFSVDYALSAFTRNQQTPLLQQKGIFKTMFGLFQARAASGYFNAVKSTLNFKTNFGDIGLNHEWVDPGYRTLGALFFNNDFENWTISSKANMWDKKVSLNGNIGVQRNNLRRTESNTSRRLIAALNTTIVPNEKLNLNLSYSNFQNTNKLRAVSLPFIQVDSIILSQVTQNASVSGAYIGGKDKNSNFTALFSFNQANSIENDEVQTDQTTTNYLGNLAHAYNFTESKLAITSAITANWGLVNQLDILSFSPTIGLSKPFLDEQLNTSTSFSFVSVYTNQVYSNSIINWQTQINYTFLKKHTVALSMALIKQKVKNNPMVENLNFTEVTGRLNYKWSF